MEKWDACGTAVGNLDGRDCWAGLDLSSTTDLSALVLAFPVGDGRVDLLPFFWVPEEGARRRERKDKVPYMQWIRDGLIEATPGEVVDYDWIRKRINELNQRYYIRQIAIDRWNATQLATQLGDDGFEIFAFGQGYASMSSPTKRLEELVLGGKMAHGGHAVLRWMAGNVSVEKDAADNWKPSRRRAPNESTGLWLRSWLLARRRQHRRLRETCLYTCSESQSPVFATRSCLVFMKVWHRSLCCTRVVVLTDAHPRRQRLRHELPQVRPLSS